jgi:8-oxo-dGTP pyrophosphatase MutT (NUDIX family)
MEPRVRDAARAVLLTPERDVLLMRMRFPWRGDDLWNLPGGGIESGESAEEAVIREVFEETGRSCVVPQGQIWRREFLVEATQVLMRQCYFLVPIDRFSPSASALLGDERD